MMPVYRPHSSANAEREAFTKKLIDLMRDNNLNQADLARKAGLTRDAISTYCRARSMPEPANLAKLAKALGVEPSHFQLDRFRVAERRMAEAQKERFEIKIQPDGKAAVEIVGVIPMAAATALADAWAKALSTTA